MYGFAGAPKDIVRQLGELTSASAIVTSLGSEGIIAWDRRSFHIEPAKDIQVIDRIGAGDAMVAGVLHGWLQGDLFKGLRYGVLNGRALPHALWRCRVHRAWGTGRPAGAARHRHCALTSWPVLLNILLGLISNERGGSHIALVAREA